jgi:hypothetical protein
MGWLEDVLRVLNIQAFFPDFNRDYLDFVYLGYNDLKKKGYDKKYNIKNDYLNRETFEFYGDAALDMIIVDLLADSFGLNISPGELTVRKQAVVKNVTLAHIGSQLKICFQSDYDVKRCADIVEASIGALYFQYRLPGLPTLKQWILSVPEIRETIAKAFRKYVQASDILSIPVSHGSEELSPEPYIPESPRAESPNLIDLLSPARTTRNSNFPSLQFHYEPSLSIENNVINFVNTYNAKHPDFQIGVYNNELIIHNNQNQQFSSLGHINEPYDKIFNKLFSEGIWI